MLLLSWIFISFCVTLHSGSWTSFLFQLELPNIVLTPQNFVYLVCMTTIILKNMHATYINPFFIHFATTMPCYYAFLLPFLGGFSFIRNNL